MKIGDKIRSIRLMKCLSQENMADMLDISLLAYGDIERGKKDITMKRLEQIANKLGTTVQDILAYEDRVSNFFEKCSNTNVNTGKHGQSIINYDTKDLLHEIEIEKLKNINLQMEVEKLKAEKEKAEMEAKYWREKVEK